MAEHLLVREIELPRPIEEIFSFFADAQNLQTLTPAWLRFEILTDQPIEMVKGALIEYRLRLRGIPLRWTSRITEWDPPHRFVDEQLRGPYRLWVHEHTFIKGQKGTLVRDLVRYRAPGGVIVNRLIIRPDLRKIFDYRLARLKEIFD